MTDAPEFAELEQARLDPASVFARPADLVSEARLSTEQKIEILRRWEYDARELLVAIEENMAPQMESGLLDEVLDALQRLGAGPAPAPEHAPTKQGGV